jgi:DNA-binding protein H-NS
MAKKAKRRGRPPGSKNKKHAVSGKSVAKMEVSQLRTYIDSLETLLAKKVQQQRAIFEGHLSDLQGYISSKTGNAVRAVMTAGRKGKRAKAKPKYQSKKKPSLKWSGRGMIPIWMREEMKGTKLTKQDFAIK